MLFFHLFLLSAFLTLRGSMAEENTTLLLVQTIFRRADRAPSFFYPTDPNSKASWPNGVGMLTQYGKKQQYEMGKFLRSMYKDFITTNPNEVYASSAADNRCLNCAELLLASFYAPEERWKLEADLNWQPIPIHSVPGKLDKMNFQKDCPRADNEIDRQFMSKKVQQAYRKHQRMVKEVSKYSGVDYSVKDFTYLLFSTLETERKHNLTIPEWAIKYWDLMQFFRDEVVFPIYYSSPIQLRLRTGPYLEILTENLRNKMNEVTPDLKFVLHSYHDLNVAGVLAALNFTNIPRPPVCATVLFELHRMADASMAVRVLYMNSTDPLIRIEEPHVLVVDGCSEFCPVEHFIKSYQWLIPDNWEKECQLGTSDTSNVW